MKKPTDRERKKRPPILINGRARQKAGGGMQPITPRPRVAQLPKAPFNDADFKVVDHRKPVAKERITPAAVNLLEKYYRRRMFWRACRHGAPVEWACQFINVKKVQGYSVLKELEEAGGPRKWFVAEALDGMARRTIRAGRATQSCGYSQAFFVVLAGGINRVEELHDDFAKMGVVDIPQLRKQHRPAVAETIDFMVANGLVGKLGR